MILQAHFAKKTILLGLSVIALQLIYCCSQDVPPCDDIELVFGSYLYSHRESNYAEILISFEGQKTYYEFADLYKVEMVDSIYHWPSLINISTPTNDSSRSYFNIMFYLKDRSIFKELSPPVPVFYIVNKITKDKCLCILKSENFYFRNRAKY